MATEVTEVLLRARMEVSGVEAGVSQIQKSLKGLTLPKGVADDLEKSFSKLTPLLKDYQKQLNKGFSSKKDLQNFNALKGKISETFGEIRSQVQSVNSQEVRLKVDTQEIDRLENKIVAKTADLQKALDNVFTKSINQSNITEQLNKVIGNTAKASTIKPMADAAKKLFNAQDYAAYNNQIDVMRNKILSLSTTKIDLAKALGVKNAEADITAVNTKITKFFDNLKVNEGKVKTIERLRQDLKDLGINLDNVKLDSLTNGANELQGVDGLIERLAGSLRETGDAASEAGTGMVRMVDEVNQLKSSTQYFFSLRNMINLLKRGIDQAIDTVKELDAAMTETAVVTDFSVGDMWTKLPEYTANANALGASVKDMYKATTLYYQQGLNTDQAMGIAAETMKMARIGGLEAADATDKMTAALRGFNMELNETSAQRVNDVYSNLAAKTASNTEELGTAMQRTASIAASAGMSFEGTAAFLAQAIETTREPAENLGTAMKTIVARFTELKKNPLEMTEVDGEVVDYNKVDTALKSIGVALKDDNGQFRNLDQVFLDIAQRWDNLTQTQQRYVATTAAGSRQQSRFIAMMSNYDRTVQLMDYANNSAGASNEQFGKTMESLEAKLNKLKNAWDQFLMGITNSSFIKTAVDGLTGIIGIVNKLVDTLSLGSGGIKSFLSVFAAFTGLKMGGNIINRLIGGLGGLVDPTSTFGRGFRGGAGSSRQAANLAQAKATSDPIVNAIRDGVQALGGTLKNVNNGNGNNNKSDWQIFNKARNNFSEQIHSKGRVGDVLKGFNGLSAEHIAMTFASNQGGAHALNRIIGEQFSNKELGAQFSAGLLKSLSQGRITSEEASKALKLDNLIQSVKAAGPEAGKAYSDAVKTELTNNAASINQRATQLFNENLLEDSTYTMERATRDAQKEHIRRWRGGIEGSDLNNLKLPELTESEKMAQGLSKVGGAAISAGQAFSTFGMILSNLGLETAGNGFMALGSTISSVGMTVANLGPMITDAAASIKKFGGGLKGIKGAVLDAGLGTAAGVAGVAAAGVAAVGLWLAYWKKREDDIKKAGEKVREDFEEGYTKKDEQISSLENSKDRFKELSEGVDQYGNNIGLTTEEYSEYLSLSREIANLAPSLIAGYDAEGNAILRKGAALDEVIDKLKKEKQAALEAYTTNSSIDKLVGEYKLSDTYKDNHSTKARGKAAGHNAFSDQRKDLNAAITNATGWTNFSDIMEGMGLGSALNIEGLSNAQLVALSQHYDDVIGVIKEKNPELKEATEDQLRGAFSDINGAINEVLAEGEPLTSALEQWMGQEKLDAAGLNLGDEFTTSFNEGLKGIELTGLTEGWDAAQFKSEIQTYANEWRNLAGPTSEYADILKDAKGVQDEYLENMGSNNAINQYNADITESCDKLIELANNTDTATAAGQAFQQQCIAQANALRNYATEGGESLSEALNTAVDDITQAEAALDNFNEATKTDLSTAAEGMKSIYEKASETYTDSYGGEYAKHFEGKGDRTAWEAGRAILSEDVLESIPDGAALQKRIKEWEPALREGEEGWYEFKEKITNNEEIQKNLKALEDAGVKLDESGFLSHIPEDQWSNVAKAIGISEEMLTSMLNKGRQFADIDFTNWGEVRHNLETSNAGIRGTSTNETGQRKLYVKESSFEASLADANYKPEEYEAKKQEGRDKQNLEYLKKASEYNQKELKGIFQDEMGFKNLNDLISGLVSTGDFTKDEIQDYAERAGYKGDFDSLYDSIAEAIDNPELYKQTSVLEKISSQIALINAADTTSEKAASDRTDFAKELYGTLGKIDSEADYFAHGRNKDNSSNLSVEEYEATKKSLEAQQAFAEQQASMAEARVANATAEGDSEEAAKWQAVADQWRQDAENIGTYLTMGAEAYAKAQQENQLVQDATQKAVDLNKEGASNEEIKAAMVESAQKMADAQMKPEEIAAAINQSYGTNLGKENVTVDEKTGKVGITMDESQLEGLQSQLDNLTANIKGNITDITFNGAALASGQNNPNSAFRRHGTMARGSRRGYTISGRPTLTGEEGEELVWEPKRNQAYMVGSNGPQFANISKDAVVWNAEQTKRIKKNSKVGNFGTGARGISHFGTMDGGNAGGLKIPGLLSVDATAAIQNVTPPTEEPTIPVKGKLEIEGNSGGALSKIKSALGGGEEKGGITEDVSINLNSAIANPEEPKQKIEAAIPKKHEASVSTSITMKSTVDAGNTKQQIQKAAANSGKGAKANVKANNSQTINVNANTSAAQAKINKLISVFNKTYTLKYKASGPHSIKVPISANFTGSWRKTVEITKGNSGAKGINNYIGHYPMPSFGSAARGKYGTVGPKNNGGLTLTGEKGFEIAWLPSENRSMILGSQGPQMLSLPSDVVIYNHEQSKKILKQQTIPAGSAPGGTQADVKYKSTRYDKKSGSSSSKKSKSKSKSKSKKKSKKKSTSKGDINNFSIQEVVRFNIDKKLTDLANEIENRTKSIEKSLAKIGTRYKDIADQTKAQVATLNNVKNQNQALLNSYRAQLNEWLGQKEKVSYTDSKGKSHDMTFNVSSYVNADGSINQAAIAKLSTREQREAVFKAVSSQAKTLTDGMNSAQKAMDDAQQKIDELGKKISEAFYQWENELTEVYDLTQRINNEVSFTDRFTSQIELELSKLGAGFGDTAQSIENTRKVLIRSNQTIKDQIKNQQQMIAARQRELKAALSYEDEVNKRQKFENKTDWGSEAEKNATIEWAKNLEQGAVLGYKYVSNIFKDIDGSIQYEIDWQKFNADNDANPYSKDTYEAIKKYLDELNDAATEFNNSIKDQTDFIKQTYDALKEYQDYVADMEDTLIKGVEEEIEEAKDNAKQISDSITNALKDLLDEVKRKLDERRQQEDNTKTERDISQKQQRLAMLRADTAGGHQVEIAQLEKEIADSQQSYQRTLEDQLLDRLQQQADEAAEQRERQIELMETSNQIDASTNKELVDMWLKDPEKYKEEIKAAWLEANGYNEKGAAGQYVLENQFESDFAQLVTAVEESNFKDNFNALTADTNSLVALLNELTNGQLGREDELSHDINALNDVTDRNTTSILTEVKKENSAAFMKARGVEADTLKTLGYTAKELIGDNPNEPIYSVSEMKQAGYTASEIKEGGISDVGKLKAGGFSAEDLKNADFSFADLFSNFTPQEMANIFGATDFKGNNIAYAAALQGFGDSDASLAKLRDAGYTEAGVELQKREQERAAQAAKAAEEARKQANRNAYNNAIKAAHKKKNVTKATLKDAITKGAADGVKKSVYQVAYDLAVGDGGGGVTWKEVMKQLKALGYSGKTVKSWNRSAKSNSAFYKAFTSIYGKWSKFATGGLASYTGPAWLDGTPSKPELVLNAADTKNFLALRDVLSSAMKSTSAVTNSYGGDIMYDINIHVDKIEKDYDVDRVVDKVKKEITKGAGYRNVTQVRNFK